MQPRRLILIHGDHARAVARAQALLAPLPSEQTQWIDQPGRGRQHLGQTLAAAVIDAHPSLNAEDLGAISGTLIAGGALILLIPPSPHAAFMQRLLTLAAACPWVETVSADDPLPEAITPNSVLTEPAIQPTADQQKAIQACQTAVSVPQPHPLLITADRGRGKSTALGLALVTGICPNARLTGPSRAAVAEVIKHAGNYPPEFLAPEDITPATDPLIIDEAAALPLGLLEKLIHENPCCVLAGTIHGYEGSGRGLELRIPTNRVTLQQPVRWAENDPLEALINQLLLFKTPPLSPATHQPHADQPVNIEWIDQQQLIDNPDRLAAIFSLLIESHYQTRPRDLQQLLEDPTLKIAAAFKANLLVGVAIAKSEGGLDPALAKPIWLGKRRPMGHLIAQSLSFHAGIQGASNLYGLRLQRIAVQSAYRRGGIGQQLIAAMQTHAQSLGCDWFGTSFSATPALLDFWHSTGLMPVRLGQRFDPHGGARAVIMLNGLSKAGQHLMAQARERFAVHLPDQIKHAQPALLPDLLQRLQHALPMADPAAIDTQDRIAFATGHRPWLDSVGALQRGVVTAATPAPDWVSAALAQPQALAPLAKQHGFTGQREYLKSLREWAATMLN